MSDKQLSEFPTVDTLNGNDWVYISQGGVERKAMLSDILATVEGGSPFNVVPTDESSTMRTIQLGDKDAFIQCLNNGGCLITIPAYTEAPFKIGDQFTVKNDSLGVVSFAAAMGVTIRTGVMGNQIPELGQAATLVNVGQDIWNLVSGSSAEELYSSKIVKGADETRVGDGSADEVVDGALFDVSLTGGNTYKVTAHLKVDNRGTGDAVFQYRLYHDAGTSSCAAGESQQIMTSNLVSPFSYWKSLYQDPITQIASIPHTQSPTQITIEAEIVLPANASAVGLYWDVIDAGEQCTVEEGSYLTVERRRV